MVSKYSWMMMNLELVNLITESGGMLHYVIKSDFYDQITVLYNYKSTIHYTHSQDVYHSNTSSDELPRVHPTQHIRQNTTP
jgi:hypothetical protein